MTFNYKAAVVNGIYINLNQDKNESGYYVEAGEIYSNGLGGSPFTSIYYPDFKKALARYNYLKRKAQKNI